MVNQPDAFKIKNLFRFLAFLAELRVIGAADYLQFLTSVLQIKGQADLLHHCVLIGISSGRVAQVLDQQAKSQLSSLEGQLSSFFERRSQHEQLMARAQQHQYPDSLRSLWTFYQSKQPVEQYGDIYLTVSEGKIGQLQQAFSSAPFTGLAQVVSQL